MKIDVKTDLWTYLAKSPKDVVMYGMGNGADKILAVCDRYGISVSDFFASDGFVRGHSFHGKRVLSYSEVKEKYGVDNMIVLLSFGSSLPDVLELFYKVDGECEMYAPDVPVCGERLFNMEFFNEHKEDLEKAYSLLADERSKEIFDCVVNYKLSGKISYLKEAVSTKGEVWDELIEKVSVAADLGAYNGDTAKELIERRPEIKKIYALEPDRRNFKKLSNFATNTQTVSIVAINAAAWNEDTALMFSDSGNRNSGAFAKGKQTEVEARSLDSILNGESVDYIKYDVEGAEKEALEGSVNTIKDFSPTLLVSAYHRSEDLFALPLQLHSLYPNYSLYLRRYPYVPAWDLNLIAVPTKKNK